MTSIASAMYSYKDKLPGTSDNGCESPLLGSEADPEELPRLKLAKPRSPSRPYPLLIASLIAVISIFANIGQYVQSTNVLPLGRSEYADLPANVLIPFEWASEYASPNLTEAGKLWDAVNFDIGMVALPYAWTEAKGLPKAQPFPWDEEQGLYVLNGHHALHCLKNIHRAIREYEQHEPQTLTLMHITHCLDALRSDILCQADDTPRYTTRSKSPESAVGQLRRCRDWSRLEAWARERTSCYNYISHKADFIDQFKRFIFCPKQSPYWPAIRRHFGMPDTWFGNEPYDKIFAEEGVEM